MIDIETLKHEIVERLKPLDPDKIILFGSYAYGTPNEDSDIDLYVVTKDEFIPQSFREKSQVHLRVSRALRDVLQTYPTDLITHTKGMYEKSLALGNPFTREITQKGISIL